MGEDSSDGGGATRSAPEGGVGGDDLPQSPKASTYKGKSCKGCLYYSSLLKSEARNPMCFGISRTLPQVPSYIVGESEMEATKDGRNLADFKYSCVGYSVFVDNKDNPAGVQENKSELPFCVGIELLVDRRASTAAHSPAHTHKEDGAARPQSRGFKPAHSAGEEFLARKVFKECRTGRIRRGQESTQSGQPYQRKCRRHIVSLPQTTQVELRLIQFSWN